MAGGRKELKLSILFLKGEGYLQMMVEVARDMYTLARCGQVKRGENSVKIQPYNSRPTLCPKSRI